MDRRSSTCTLLLLLTLALSGSNVQARGAEATNPSGATAPAAGETAGLESNEAQKRVTDAVSVVRAMVADPQVRALVQESKGLLIVPHFFKAALIFGGQGGPALMLVQRNGRWSDPAFYRTRSGSFGAQIGATTGALVMILTSDRAVRAFTVKSTSWSLNVGAGLTAASYSKDMQQPATHSDVIIWSDSKGLFGGAAVAATRVAADERTNQEYYDHADVTGQQILSGLVANPYSNRLREVLAMQHASK